MSVHNTNTSDWKKCFEPTVQELINVCSAWNTYITNCITTIVLQLDLGLLALFLKSSWIIQAHAKSTCPSTRVRISNELLRLVRILARNKEARIYQP